MPRHRVPGQGLVVQCQFPAGLFAGSAQHGAQGLQQFAVEIERQVAFACFAQRQPGAALAAGVEGGFAGEQRCGAEREKRVVSGNGLAEIAWQRRIGFRDAGGGLLQVASEEAEEA